MGWQPIETAPKAGLRRILIWRNGRAEIAHWAIMVDECGEPQGGWWWTDGLIRDQETQPTHWHPLPQPPTQENA